MKRKVLAKVRLPLTIDERLDVLAILERRHPRGRLVWQDVPVPGGKWFVVEQERER